MKIKDIEVQNVIGASGITNFFGEGYIYHILLFIAFLFPPIWVLSLRYWKWQWNPSDKPGKNVLEQLIAVSDEIPLWPMWLSFDGTTKTTKTATAFVQEGNMPMRANGTTPRDFHPHCIYVDMSKNVALNNVALSGPGIVAILNRNILQQKQEPVIISIMAIGKTKEERDKEIAYITSSLFSHLPRFKGKVIGQMNISCPNTEGELALYLEEVFGWVTQMRVLGIPLTVKISCLTPPEVVVRLAEVFDAIFAINTLPFGELTPKEREKYFYNAKESPLMKYQDEFEVKGAGGVSGEVLLERGLAYLRTLRGLGITIPIVYGGGILKPEDVDAAKAAGADAISLGSIIMIKPWNLRKVIQRGHEIFD